ncbi:slow green 1, chloroplastic-like protein [Tanacetum coccineum]
MELSLTTTTFTPTTTLYCRTPKSITFPKPTSFKPLPPIKSSLNPNPKNPTLLSTLKTTVVTGVTVAAIFLTRKHALAAPLPTPRPVETTTAGEDDQLEEKTLEDYLCTYPDDVKAIKSLMEVKIKNGKVHEAIALLNQLIELEPSDSEWQLLKYHLHSYSGDHENAKLGFEGIIQNDPLKVEAYHGLVMAASAKEAKEDLENVEKRIIEGMEVCKKAKKKDEVRDFKLLLAQIRVIKGEYDDALRIYEELCKEEPRDFRPYLCQGIIYTLLGKSDDAEKMFGKYRRLVPKGHPYTRYFDDNMVATKVFAQKVENERAYAKS